MMIDIPLIDARETGLYGLVQRYSDDAKSLIDASRNTFGAVSHAAAGILLPIGDVVSRRWLERTKNPYLDEITRCAKILDVHGVYALNIVFEWGCTSSAFAKPQGPVLTRVMDWPFKSLGEKVVIAHLTGPAGDYYAPTWPGLLGIFQGMAPGRFACAINQAPLRRHGSTFAGDWIQGRRAVFSETGIPPAHLLRQVFESASTYDEAVNILSTTRLALPAIFTIAGINDSEGCVIERTEHSYAILPMGDRVCATNHFRPKLDPTGNGWRGRPPLSQNRLRAAETIDIATVNEDFDWFKAPIANSNSKLVMEACPRTCKLSAFGANGEARTTNIFILYP